MRFHVLATDYDGTIAHHGVVEESTREALARARAAGRKLVLVTGRELPDLERVFPEVNLFDAIVAENGALVYQPGSRQLRALAEPPPEAFAATLRARGVAPLSVGHVIVATWEPHEKVVLDVIRELGLELQVIFNKGAVMVLPSGINKAVGCARRSTSSASRLTTPSASATPRTTTPSSRCASAPWRCRTLCPPSRSAPTSSPHATTGTAWRSSSTG
jgi:hydroxymethylpyrimidine pyrophosphatase-like HAD family hydrolase